MSQMDSTFERLINVLREQARTSESSLINVNPPTAESLGTTDVPPPARFDHEAESRFFDPVEAIQTYEKAVTAISGFNAVKNVIASKIQSDVLSQLERDMKMRRCTRLQVITLEAGRRRRHGSKFGPITSGLKKSVSQLISLGK